jgi:putative ABC transport system permease protein
MNGLLQDVRIAFRGLRQKPGFAVLAIVILALGTGATTIMFTVVSGVLLKPLAYPDPDSLVTVHVRGEKFGDVWGFSYPDFLDCERECHSFENVAAWAYGGGTVSAPGEPQYVTDRRISAALFSVLRAPLVKGRSFASEEDQLGANRVAIISTRLWQQRYASDPQAVGKLLLYDGAAYTIVGIAPPGFQLDGDADVLTPLGQANEPRMRWRGARFLHVIARLRRGVTLEQAQSELAVESQRLAKQYPSDDGAITEVPHPLQSELVHDVKPTLWLLLGAVGVVLLIGCVNVASLFLTRVVARQHEFTLRLALGAQRGRLIRQCLTESGVLGICGGALGLLLAIVGTHPFVRYWPDGLPRADEIHADWRVLLFSITTSILSGFIFGLIPALRSDRGTIEQTLRSQSRTIAGSARRPLRGLVMSLIAFSLGLLSVAGILGRTLLRLSSLNPGIDIHNVLTAHVAVSPEVLENPEKARADWQQLLDQIKSVPAVKSAALADIVAWRFCSHAWVFIA